MDIKNIYDKSVADGEVTWWAIDEKGDKTELLFKSNTVLNEARFIMRDLLSGSDAGNTITHVHIGDNNIKFTDNLDITPSPVSPAETALNRKIAELPVVQVDRNEVSGRPSVTFTFKVNKDNNLGSESGSAIIAECGLATANGKLFSKVVHKPIIKRPFAGLILQWTIIF